MKSVLLFTFLVAAVFCYFRDSPLPRSKPDHSTASAQPAPQPLAAAPAVVIAPLPSYSTRWKTGPNAQADLKTGPNAQTDFEPFAPSEQANWNQTPGYTVIAGINMPRR